MKPNNKLLLASAGAGKTTHIAEIVTNNPDKKYCVTTYTNNGEKELRKKIWELGGLPPKSEASALYSLLLKHFCKPYQNMVFPNSDLRRINLTPNASGQRRSKKSLEFYQSSQHVIYADKLSAFALEANEKSSNAVLDRFSQIFDVLVIDEVQDLGGYDLDLLHLILQSEIEVILVGDLRQTTYKTSKQSKNKQYAKDPLPLFQKWAKSGLLTIEEKFESHRCCQEICDFSDELFPDYNKTTSLYETEVFFS